MIKNKTNASIMPKANKPTLEEWAALYKSATELKKMAPWDWMSDADLFGVQNPYNQEIGYCCILGELGEVYGLVVYLGKEGLETYHRIQHADDEIDMAKLFFQQKYLMVSFTDREYLEPEDLKVIKTLGLKFRGANEYPQFRSQPPGYVPWFLTKDEGLFLNIAIQQAMEVANRFKKDPTLLSPVESGKYLIRVSKMSGNELIWTDAWLKPEPWQKQIILPQLNEERLAKIKTNITSKMTWEVDAPYFIDIPIMEKERPYVPRLLLIVDTETRFVFGVSIIKPTEYPQTFPDKFLDILEKNSMLPEKILVKSDEVFQLLYPITSFLGIKLEKVTKLNQLRTVLNEMQSILGQRNR